MSDLEKITLENGTTLDIKDSTKAPLNGGAVFHHTSEYTPESVAICDGKAMVQVGSSASRTKSVVLTDSISIDSGYTQKGAELTTTELTFKSTSGNVGVMSSITELNRNLTQQGLVNLSDGNWKQGAYNTGTKAYDSSMTKFVTTTNPIVCSAGDKLVAKYEENIKYIIAWYGKDGVATITSYDTVTSKDSIEFTVPSGCDRVWISVGSDASSYTITPTTAKKIEVHEDKGLYGEVTELKETLSANIDILSGSTIVNGHYKTSSTEGSSDSWNYAVVDVKNLKNITFGGNTVAGQSWCEQFFDNGTKYSYSTSEQTVQVPSGATKFYFNFQTTDKNNVYITTDTVVGYVAENVPKINESLAGQSVSFVQGYPNGKDNTTSSNNYICTKAYECKAGDTIVIESSYKDYAIYYFKADGTSISSVEGDYQIAPTDASYFRIRSTWFSSVTPSTITDCKLFLNNKAIYETNQLKNDLTDFSMQMYSGNMNNLLDSGMYILGGATNVPVENNNYLAFICKVSSSITYQFLILLNSKAMYKRRTTNGGSSWESWS